MSRLRQKYKKLKYENDILRRRKKDEIIKTAAHTVRISYKHTIDRYMPVTDYMMDILNETALDGLMKEILKNNLFFRTIENNGKETEVRYDLYVVLPPEE